MQLKKNLTKDEGAAIGLYTRNYIYPSLNEALRSKEAVNIQPWFSYLKLFHNAVKKLTSTNRLLCRGEPTDWIKSPTAGAILTWVPMSSFFD